MTNQHSQDSGMVNKAAELIKLLTDPNVVELAADLHPAVAGVLNPVHLQIDQIIRSLDQEAVKNLRFNLFKAFTDLPDEEIRELLKAPENAHLLERFDRQFAAAPQVSIKRILGEVVLIRLIKSTDQKERNMLLDVLGKLNAPLDENLQQIFLKIRESRFRKIDPSQIKTWSDALRGKQSDENKAAIESLNLRLKEGLIQMDVNEYFNAALISFIIFQLFQQDRLKEFNIQDSQFIEAFCFPQHDMRLSNVQIWFDWDPRNINLRHFGRLLDGADKETSDRFENIVWEEMRKLITELLPAINAHRGNILDQRLNRLGFSRMTSEILFDQSGALIKPGSQNRELNELNINLFRFNKEKAEKTQAKEARAEELSKRINGASNLSEHYLSTLSLPQNLDAIPENIPLKTLAQLLSKRIKELGKQFNLSYDKLHKNLDEEKIKSLIKDIVLSLNETVELNKMLEEASTKWGSKRRANAMQPIFESINASNQKLHFLVRNLETMLHKISGKSESLQPLINLDNPNETSAQLLKKFEEIKDDLAKLVTAQKTEGLKLVALLQKVKAEIEDAKKEGAFVKDEAQWIRENELNTDMTILFVD